MAESGTEAEQPSSPTIRRTRSNAMIIDDDKSTTNPKEESTEIISNPTKGSKPDDDISKPTNGDIATSKPIDRHAVVDGCTESPKEHSQFSSTLSEPVLLHRNNTSPNQDIHKSKLDFLSSERGDDGCKRCKELESTISLWELGVSGITRNYSKILSQLNKVQTAATKLDGQLKEKVELTTSRAPMTIRNSSVSGRKAVTVRQSMFEPGSTTLPPTNIAEQMYPQESSTDSVSGSTKLINDLNSHLSQAIDLCQQLAAASFKNNQRSSKRKLQRQVTVHSGINDGSSNFRPALQSIAESSLSDSYKKKRTLERAPSAPGSMMNRPSEHQASSLTNGLEPEVATDSESKVPPDVDTPSAVSNGLDANPTNQRPFYSHMMKLCLPDDLESEHSTELSGESLSRSEDMQEYRGSILSSVSTFSDTDVKQIMSKIADLEEERVKLLTTIDDMHRDNNTVRLSLNEILEDLENKDLQLTLALQDLTIATGEIRRAAEMRKQLQEMESEHNDLLERLSNLEDESAAVKVSLIQLLQEKSATNKTLALENWRLNQRIKAGTLRRASAAEGDNVSVTSGFSSLTEDAALQEAYMGADDVASFVHKQGFLVKQGGRRKNWKKRLFVLSPEGLSYYKTEQPLQMLPLDKIEKIQICHGRTTLPHSNIFEVYTPGRVFLLSAPTEDDMQSWVGMLQTLKQYNKGTTLNREASTKRAITVGGASALPPTELANAHSDSDTDGPDHSFHRTIHQSFGSVERGPPTLALADSSEDEMLEMHTDHFGSRRRKDDVSVEIGGSPKSVPEMNTLGNAANFDHPSPQLLARLRSDSCS